MESRPEEGPTHRQGLCQNGQRFGSFSPQERRLRHRKNKEFSRNRPTILELNISNQILRGGELYGNSVLSHLCGRSPRLASFSDSAVFNTLHDAESVMT